MSGRVEDVGERCLAVKYQISVYVNCYVEGRCDYKDYTNCMPKLSFLGWSHFAEFQVAEFHFAES